MKKRYILILGIIICVLSVSAVSAGLFDGLFGEEKAQDNVIEIDNITFHTTNVSTFKLFNSTEELGTYWYQYVDENNTGYTLNIYNFSTLNDSDFNESLEGYKEHVNLSSTSSKTIDGIIVYTTSADIGDHIGDTRYVACVINDDLKILVDICTPDANETAKIASTLKFKDK